jgi:excisionase family DNA binding protein
MKTSNWPDCSECPSRPGHATSIRGEGAALTLSVTEAASLLGIGKSLMYELVRNGQIPYVLLGATIRIPRRPLEAWLEDEAQASANHRRGHR